jgi:hypothetical protein
MDAYRACRGAAALIINVRSKQRRVTTWQLSFWETVPDNFLIEGWVGSRAGLDDLERRGEERSN